MNLNEQTVEVYREPHFTGYAATPFCARVDTIAPLAFPDAAVDVAELLKK